MRAIDKIEGMFMVKTSTAGVILMGGKYQLHAASGSWSGATFTVRQLGPDGSTWLPSTTLALSANGAVTADLPPGDYRLTVGNADPSDPIHAILCQVPGE